MDWSWLWDFSRQAFLLRRMARDLRPALKLDPDQDSLFPSIVLTNDPGGTHLGLEAADLDNPVFCIRMYKTPSYDRVDTIAAYLHELGHWLLRVKNPEAIAKYTYARLRWNVYRYRHKLPPGDLYTLTREDIDLILFDESNAWAEAFKMMELPVIKKLLKGKGDMDRIRGLADEAFQSYKRVADQRLDKMNGLGFEAALEQVIGNILAR